MGKVLVTEQHLMDIASAIRDKLDSEDTYRPGDMAAAIRAIEGYPEPTGTVTISQNGTANVKDYAAAAVNVQPVLQQKTVTQNGTVTPDSGYDGLSSVVVDVQSSGDDFVPNFAARVKINNGSWTTYNDLSSALTAANNSGTVVLELAPMVFIQTASFTFNNPTSLTVKTIDDVSLNPSAKKAKIVFNANARFKSDKTNMTAVIIENIDFDGKGRTYSVDVGGFFWVYNNVPTTIRDCIFENQTGGAWSSGAFYSAGPLTVENCRFENIANTGNGGCGVTRCDANATFTNCTFGRLLPNGTIDQNAIVKATVGGGGAIGTLGTVTVTFNNCKFYGCESGADGGAIYTYKKCTKLEINNCEFIDCSASGNGDAIYVNADTSIDFDNLTINGVTTTATDKSVPIAGVYYAT